MKDSSLVQASSRTLWLIVLLWLPGCRETPPSDSVVIWTVTVTDDVLRVVRSDPAPRVEIVVSRDVPYRMLSEWNSDSGTQEVRYLIGGDELEFVGGTVKIGDRSFGAFDQPTLIEIKPDGIFVNGELSGPPPGK